MTRVSRRWHPSTRRWLCPGRPPWLTHAQVFDSGDVAALLEWYLQNTGPRRPIQWVGGVYDVTDAATAAAVQGKGYDRIRLVGPGASGVTLSNFYCSAASGFLVELVDSAGTPSNVTVRNALLDGQDSWTSTGIGGVSYANGLRVERVRVRRCGADGIRPSQGAIVEDCIVHEAPAWNPSVHGTYDPNGSQTLYPHTDALQLIRGGVTARRCWLETPTAANGTGATMIKPGSDLMLIDGVLVERCYLSGGGYSVHVHPNGTSVPTNVTYRDNRFGRAYRDGLWSHPTMPAGSVAKVDNRWIDGAAAPVLQGPLSPGTVTGLIIDRSGDPDGRGRWSHMPPRREWPPVFWVPPGSTFQAPNGEYVIRDRIVNGIKHQHLVDRGLVANIVCPEVFENIPNGTNVINMRGVAVMGHHIRQTRWLGDRQVIVYRTRDDAANRVNGFRLCDDDGYNVKPGKWWYNELDTPYADGTDRRHRQAIYAQAFNYDRGVDAGELTFQAWERTRVEGPCAPEGLNWSSGDRHNYNQVLRISGYYQDRVWVLQWASNDNKVPGGDGVHLHTGIPEETIVHDVTIDRTSHQGVFLQVQGTTPRHMDFRRINVRGETDMETYGGSLSLATSGFKWWGWEPGSYGETFNVEDVSVYDPNYPIHQLVGPDKGYGPLWYPMIENKEVPNWVKPEDVGAATAYKTLAEIA